MSKEKQCECCHEWWYASEIKNDLCPNCYDYFKQLKQQLAEKQNTIDEINKEFVQAVHDWKTLCAEKDKEISKLQASCQQVKTQLAIQELEKVKIMAGNLLEKFCSSWEYHQKYMRGHRHIEYYDLIQGIDNQIKELRGE